MELGELGLMFLDEKLIIKIYVGLKQFLRILHTATECASKITFL